MKEETVWRLNGWGSIFRFITPILVTIGLFILTEVRKDIQIVSERIYQHQTNAEFHVPRGEFERIRSEIADMRREVIATLRKQTSNGF